MNSFFKTIVLFFCLAPFANAQTLDIHTGHEMKRIAFSAKAGVEVFAEASDGKWCEDILSLKIFAQDETAFGDKSLSGLMSKIALVLNSECPSATQAIIDGYSSNTLVFQGSASADEKWKPEKGTLKVKIQQLQAAAVKTSGNKNDFSVKKWTPPDGKQKIVARIDPDTALEHRIFSKDKECSILYTTDKPAAKLKKWFISVGGNSCAENLIYGRADVSVFNEKGDLETTLDGYFTEGRFTGKKNLNVVLLNRYGVNKNVQLLSYLIDSDMELKIHYISYLKSQRNQKTGFYSPWAGCSPFIMAAVTENEELFLESSVTDNILRTAQSFADIFCPGTTQMKFFATKVPQGIPGMDIPAESSEASPQEDTRLIYSAILQRTLGQKWKIVSDKTQNLARLRENTRKTEDLREHQLMMADYNELTKTDYLGRLAYMIGADRIDNLPAMLTAAAIIKKPLRVNLLINIASIGLDRAWADWPDAILITQTSGLLNRTGWHILSGTLRPMTEQEKKQNNKTAPFSAGVLELYAAAACEQDACGEVSDLIGLIRRRHEKPNWLPYHAPYGQGEINP
ncbi:MAG: hypothetical protein J5787_02650 [Alphaproteobacteria bacterium]|nr:hypothetical protein [Alphaproteobacteria bacterium]